jgi:hypothetical protein
MYFEGISRHAVGGHWISYRPKNENAFASLHSHAVLPVYQVLTSGWQINHNFMAVSSQFDPKI